MSSAVGLDLDGTAAPPRTNGELVFAEPWESRAFALAVALVEQGLFTWEEFRARLIDRIAVWETAEPFRYYRCWLEALEQLTADRGATSTTELELRADELLDRPSGHDHDHDDLVHPS